LSFPQIVSSCYAHLAGLHWEKSPLDNLIGRT
jgi:hypothetical protein